jgi:hypothetical protein
MKYWSNVVVEGHCMGNEDEDGKNPCGRHVPSPFCLGNGRCGICPHFGWTDATERDAARFVPLRIILWDKIKIYAYEVWSHLEWFFWGQLWFNRRKMDEFFKSIEVIPDDDPCMVHFRKEEEKSQAKFEKWFPKAKKEW